MIPGEPSRTALAAATHRAVHQLLEGGEIFTDPLAVRILAADEAALCAEAEADPRRRPMRFFIAARHRLAEDAAARAVAAGLDQIVVLGAGLDTLAYRSPHGDTVTIFEVDHPATQAWKQARLAETGIAVPPWVRYAAVDFEAESFIERLADAGFDPHRRTFFVWLGVVPYLTETAIFATIAAVAALSGGAEIVFDYANPPSSWPDALRPMLEARAARVAALGEAWISYFEAEPLAQRLRDLGFVRIEDFGPADIVRRFRPEGAQTFRDKGGHIVLAGTK